MTHNLEETLFKIQVWAEMKKSVTYNMDIKLDKYPIISEARCECAAGQGPTAHCKHIGATLFPLSVFAEDGISYASEATCTQVDMSTYRLSYVYIHVVIHSFLTTSPICSTCCNATISNHDMFHFMGSYFSEAPIISQGNKV